MSHHPNPTRQAEPATQGTAAAEDKPAAAHADAGAVTITTLFIGLIAVLFAAALLGGGVLFGAKARGYDLAQAAARAGAQQLDLTAYRADGVVKLAPAAATTAARQFLAAAGATGRISVTTARITVTATSRQPTPMLRPFGTVAVTVTATASAAPATGPRP